MKAAFYEHQGAARDVLHIGERPVPHAGPGEVRVRIRVSGVNPTDLKARSGGAGPMAFPLIIPHQDGAGVVDEVGDGVPASRLGERVWVYEAQSQRPYGTAAEYVVLPASQAVALPARTSMEVGACLGIPAITAHRCLFADGPLADKRVLIQGGAGAVGNAAILLAKWAGAFVVTTVSNAHQAALAREAGADTVVFRHQDGFAEHVMEATEGKGVDHIVEVDVAANIDNDLTVLSNAGTVSCYAFRAPGDSAAIPVLRAMRAGASFRFVFVYTMPAQAKAAAVADIERCLSEGAYAPAIALRLPLNRIVQAHEAQENGVVGKVVLHVATD